MTSVHDSGIGTMSTATNLEAIAWTDVITTTDVCTMLVYGTDFLSAKSS